MFFFSLVVVICATIASVQIFVPVAPHPVVSDGHGAEREVTDGPQLRVLPHPHPPTVWGQPKHVRHRRQVGADQY